MNPTNPFESQNSAQEQLKKSRARLQLAVIGGFGVCLVVASLMLLQGCKREEPAIEPAPVDTNAVAVLDTNLTSLDPIHSNIVTLPPINIPTYSNSPVGNIATTMPVEAAPVATTGGSEYSVAKGDSFYTIAKKNGVSTKAMADANPGVDSKKLKIGQKLNIPAATATVATATATHTSSEGSYKVKSGDTLMKIAKSHGTTYKALKAANGLTTDRIKVGQKLTIPGKAVAAPAEPIVEPAPMISAPITTLPPLVMPAPAK